MDGGVAGAGWGVWIKAATCQSKGARRWLLVMEQNLVNVRFPFTRPRLYSLCPALELPSGYLLRNQKVNHSEPSSGRERTTLLSVAKCEKKVDFSFPARPRSPDTIFTLGARRNALFITRVPGQARICVMNGSAVVRNIKARSPWQGSQAGLCWHPRDFAEQG